MLQAILNWRLDAAILAAIMFGATALIHGWLRRRHGAGIPRTTWLLLAATALVGVLAAEMQGLHERIRLRGMLQGIAPTYALELERAGHWLITADTPPDDPLYLDLIRAELRWLKVNPAVNDVYTFRLRGDGQIVFIVDSETDYNRDGLFAGDREARTAIGEVYPEATPNMLRACTGQAVFDDVPEADRWGTWVSAYVPLHNPQGKVDAVLGVDYAAHTWLASIAAARLTMLAIALVLAVVLVASGALLSITQCELQKRLEIQRQLVVASRQAGMAEIATDVLHNVGNALNSVNISAASVTEKLRASKLASLSRAVGLIREHEQDLPQFLAQDARGRQLPHFLQQLSGFLETEQSAMLEDLALVTRSIDHIKEIVRAQQAYARPAAACEEPLDLAELLEEAIRMNGLSLERHGIAIERRLADCPPVRADRHLVLQILVNLVSNARQAVIAAAGADKRIVLELGLVPDTPEPTARLRISDNGVGIPPENLAKIFNHGFTTREGGHGFGLHAAAIHAHQMGGSLAAHSAGPGRGATFTLEIPVQPRPIGAARSTEATHA